MPPQPSVKFPLSVSISSANFTSLSGIVISVGMAFENNNAIRFSRFDVDLITAN